MAVVIGATGLNFSTPPSEITLAGAQAYLIPSGQYITQLGLYSTIEWYDSNLGFWRAWASNPGRSHVVVSDGTNFRLINRTGCPMGAIITSFGASYTSAPVVTASSGGSLWKSIVGGAINTTVTVTTGGAYNYVPTLIFSPPPAGGVQASGIAVISAGAISSVTVTNRGAGYVSAPTITIVQDPRDTAAGGGVLTVNATLVGGGTAGQVTAVICTDPGTAALTALPTLTFTGGGGASAAATVIMNWTATGITVVTGGAAYGNANPFQVIGNSLLNASVDASGDVNPAANLGLTQPRNFRMYGTSTSAGAVTATGLVIDDAGWGIQAVPGSIILPSNGSAVTIPTTAAQATVTVGATTDTNYLQLVKL